MKRNKAYYRWQRRRAIHHKAWIVRYAWKEDSPLFWTPSRIGALSKGKIHCSCWMCRRKSYDELSRTDKRKQEACKQQLEEITNEDTCTDQETDKAPSESISCSEKEYVGQR